MTGDGLTSSGQPSRQWWPLLHNLRQAGPWPLLLVVHGHGGGALPPLLEGWSSALAERRGAAVWMQALTADPIALPAAQPLLLVPLLLTPGSHVRHDLPAIRDRLRAAGHPVMALPFLGSWAPWLDHLADLARATGGDCLLHHPLRPGVADRYLAALSRRLELEPVSADRQDAQRMRPLPLALAPNRMTAQLQAEGLDAPALLERPATQDFLFQLLLSLP